MNHFVFISFLAVVASLICANMVYSLDRRNPIHQTFALMCAVQGYCAFTAFMMMQAGTAQNAIFWLRLSDIWSFDMALLLHFVLLVTGTRIGRVPAAGIAIYSMAAIASLLSLHRDIFNPSIMQSLWGWNRASDLKTAAGLANVLWPALASISAMTWVTRCFIVEKQRRKKQQLGLITLALFVPFITASITYGIPRSAATAIPDFTFLALTIQAIIIVVAMRKYKLFTVSVATAAPNIIAAMADGLLLLDAKNAILMANNSASKMLGYSGNDLNNRPFASLFSTSTTDPATVAEFILNSRSIPRDFELKTKNGKTVPVNLTASHLYDDSGETAGVVCLVRDISYNRRSEEQLKTAAHRLQQGNQELQEFLFAASHHLQEPLRKIRTLGSRLRVEPAVKESTQARDFLNRMVRNAQWMQRLLDSLREYLALETDTAAVETIDLQALVRTAAELVEDRTSTFKPVFEIGHLPIIEGKRSQLGNLFIHLLENAVKFRKPDVPVQVQVTGKVVVTPPHSTVSGVPLCEIKIKDNGTGFDNQYHERIFGVFQRLSATDNERSGAGIGLAICRKIAQYHGGTITAQSEPGNGAVFTLLLPVQQEGHQISI